MRDESVNRKEIALQWDAMEQELQDKDFWSFLTQKKCDTHIDLLLRLMAGEVANSKDEYATFFYFSEQLKAKKTTTTDLWEDIRHVFFTLKGWFVNNELYHKIGCLIACGTELKSIYDNYRDRKKDEFNKWLDNQIKGTVALQVGMEYADLSYEKNSALLGNILLLFNVMSVLKLDGGAGRFSFNEYKNKRWSLEHINAQQSQPLDKLAEWKEWLRLHKPYVARQNNSKPSDNGEQLLNKVDHLLRLQSFAKTGFIRFLSAIEQRLTARF